MDAEGFSGRDGRTTIFDWWKIPSIGRLIEYIHKNEGLTPEEAALLEKWRNFLNMAASVPAIASGKTFDLCYCNYDPPGFDPDRHFAFLRGDGLQTWLFVCNFSDITNNISILIPKEAIDYLAIKNLDPETRIEVEVSSDDCTIIRLN